MKARRTGAKYCSESCRKLAHKRPQKVTVTATDNGDGYKREVRRKKVTVTT